MFFYLKPNQRFNLYVKFVKPSREIDANLAERERDMARPMGKQSYGRVVLVSCVALLGAGLVADFLWASSHRFSSVGMSLPSSVIGQLPPNSNVNGSMLSLVDVIRSQAKEN